MSAQFWINVLVRWIHISSAVVGVGALVFVRLAVIPAMVGEPESAAWARVMRRFKLILHSTIGLLLLSGIYNLIVVIPRANALADLKPFYHAVLGTKILLALILFAIAILLLAPWPSMSGLRSQRSEWLAGTIVLAAAILFASAILRRTWDLAPPRPAEAGSSQATPEPSAPSMPEAPPPSR